MPDVLDELDVHMGTFASCFRQTQCTHAHLKMNLKYACTLDNVAVFEPEIPFFCFFFSHMLFDVGRVHRCKYQATHGCLQRIVLDKHYIRYLFLFPICLFSIYVHKTFYFIC